MRTGHCFQEGKRGEVKGRKDGGGLAKGPGSTYPPLPPPVWLLSHLEASGRGLSWRRFLSGKCRTTEAVAHNALRWRVGVCRRSQGRK